MPDRTATVAGPEIDGIEATVRRAQSGDTAAFGDLYDAYVATVYRYVLAKVSAVPVAEDLTSETFVRALRKLDSYSAPGGNFVAWLLTIARNLIFDHYRSGWVRLAVVTEEIEPEHEPSAGPEQAALAALDAELLRRAVGGLAEEQRECIVLRFFSGLSIAETARTMGRTEGAIKQLQWRATRRLHAILTA
ncbi:sigma-70 family RNA polymerase sigma factor [Kribbella endophytica]